MPYIKDYNKVRFAQTASATVASTDSETTLVSTGVGSTSLMKDSSLAGKTFKVYAAGVYSNTGTPALTLKVKLGSSVLLTTGAVTTVTGASDRAFVLEGLVTIRTVGASGTSFGQGLVFEDSTAKILPMTNTSTVAVDTTGNLAFDVTATWDASSASNTITLTNLVIEEVN